MKLEDFTIREILFHGMTGCSNHGCIITGPKQGMGTNGPCRCIQEMNRVQLSLLAGRIQAIAGRKLKEQSNG